MRLIITNTFRLPMQKMALTLATVLLISSFGFGKSNDIRSLKLHWEHYTLTNGLEVLLQPDLSRPDVAIEFWVHVGVRHEPPNKAGLAHFFEHATPYGLRDRPDHMRVLRDNMNYSNAQTRMDYIRYFFQINPQVFELGLHYVSDRLKADITAITDELVEKHRKNVLAEFDRQTKHPFWGGKQRALRHAGTFGENHPYGHSAYGTRKNNENFTTHDFREWYDKYVFAENTTLFIVGHFNIEETRKLIEHYFSDIHQKKPLKKSSPVSAIHTTKKLTVKIPSDTHTMMMTWAAPAWGSDDDAAVRLLANIVQQRLAQTSEPIAEAGAHVSLYQLAGEFVVFASFSSLGDSVIVENWLQETIGKLIQGGVSENELRVAQEQELESVKSQIENKQLGFIGSRTELIGEGLLFTGEPDFYLSRLTKQHNLTTRDIQHVAKKWLGPEAFRFLAVSTTVE